MKPAALRHLLLDRIRRSLATGDPAQQPVLRDILETLAIDQHKTWFTIHWRDPEGERSLEVPQDTFSFYLAGDTVGAIAKRGETGDVRQKNWKAAADIIGRMVTISGGAFDVGATEYAMNTEPKPLPLGLFSADGLILAAVAGAIDGWRIDTQTGALIFLASVLAMTLISRAVISTDRSPLGIIGKALVATGILAGTWLGGALLLAVLLLGVTAPCLAELANPRKPQWLLAGLAGAPLLWVGLPGHLAAFVLVLAAFVSCWMMANRFSWLSALLYVAGIAVGLFVHPAGFSLPAPTRYDAALLVPAFLLLLSASLWWFHGVQKKLFPWYAQFGLLAACVGAFMTGGEAMVGLTGFAIVLDLRVIRNFQVSRRRVERPSQA